ncbi:DUF3239 domain-containing protein [Corynebacterium mendelii]|uniref:DUF3239 domain-containing protein n=1 Tax=Corynebacterium mendelii TaxID=2765362 RepID=A0A939IU78_9CORY|nr:DUF3239 domain-containing protein [Corynebacterium mendelii]MBN9644644.1 DUF3239 domain-containing protein [Corynebacterium mendelii]
MANQTQKNFHFTVDDKHNRTYDEYYRDPKQLQMASAGLGLMIIAVGLYFAWSEGFKPGGIYALVAFGMVGLVFIAIAAVLPKKVGTPQTVYDTYPLAPAVIADIDDETIWIMALVDAATDPGNGERRGLALRAVTALPGHKKTVGERVPVTAVPGRRAVLKNRDHWAEMTLLPIAWGTPDKSVIQKASHAVPEGRWRKLKQLQPKFDEVKNTKTKLLIVDGKR